MSSTWIYILGEKRGRDMKIGRTTKPTVAGRIANVNGTQHSDAEYILLAAVRGESKDEVAMHDYFAEWRQTGRGSHREYYDPVDELVEYAAWLRSEWYASVDEHDALLDAPVEDPTHWLPTPTRRSPRPVEVEGEMFQPYETAPGALPGPWAWFPNPRTSFQDYFTPPEIIDAARKAMGGIDLDAASHWAANRVHKIPNYFTATRSAMDHDWHGRVWLNPPYGNNGPWFDRALKYLGSGDVEQMCMLSPVWAFTTAVAAEFMARHTAMVLLSPTPKFWGNEAGKTGTNNPHAVVYLGDRVEEFRDAFSFNDNICMRIDSRMGVA